LYPSLDRYLESLPNGIDSYPEATVKGAVLRSMLLEVDFKPEPGVLPAAVERCAQEPPATSTWVPETFHGALSEAIYDARFHEHGGMPAFESWVLERSRKLISSPLYKVLFFVVRPERVFIGAQKRWSAFHRGSRFEITDEGATRRTVRLSHPPHLFSHHALHAFAASFRAAGECAGLRQVQVRFDRELPGATIYTVEWSA
jgi:hypothetical protein